MNAPDATTRDAQWLHGLLHGLLTDGRISVNDARAIARMVSEPSAAPSEEIAGDDRPRCGGRGEFVDNPGWPDPQTETSFPCRGCPDCEPAPAPGPIERLADLLDRYEAAQDAVTQAHRAKTAVEDDIRTELGIKERYLSQDKLTAAVLRALVRERRTQREAA